AKIGHWCDQISIFFLFGFVLAAPHSIFGSQVGFLISVLCWLISCACTGKISLRRTSFDWPLLALFGWATLSACFSYEPLTSLNGLRGPAFFTVCYYVATRASEHPRRTRQLVATLILSCLVNLGLTFYQKAVGEGLRIDTMTKDSRMIRVGLVTGD